MLTAPAAYTAVINLLNYSVVVIPVTKADRNLDVADESYQPLSATDKLNWEACRFCCWVLLMSECSVLTSASDDPDIYHGGPVGVQLVARKFEEEKIWAIAKIVAAALEKMKAEIAEH